MIDFEKDKPELSHFVYKVSNKCNKIDESVMRVWKEDDQGKYEILLDGKMQLHFYSGSILEKGYAVYGSTLIEGVKEMIPFFEKHFKETTEELKEDSPGFNARVFRKDFEYEVE